MREGSRSSTLLVFRMEGLSLSLSDSFSVGDLGGTCLHVRRTPKNKMLRRVVLTCTVRTYRRLLSRAVESTGQKRVVDHSQLSDGYAMAGGAAQSPVTLQIGLIRQSVMCG